MEKTTRRNLLKAAAVGGVAATGLGALAGANKALALARTQSGPGGDEHDHGQNEGKPLSGPRSHAVVSFGQWDATGALPPATPGTPLDRHPTSSPNNRNVHKVLPFDAEIDEGGAVSFIISGAHQILIYDDGTTLQEVREAADTNNDGVVNATDTSILPIGPGLVDVPTKRIYRGLNPLVLNYDPTVGAVPPPPAPVAVRDRIESVNFDRPGRFLAVCGVLPHFNEGMHGFVTVRKRNDD